MDELNGKEQKELTEIEEMELERRMMELAYENSYRVLTNKLTFKELMSGNHGQGRSAIMAHDPQEGVNIREMEVIIRFFEEREEYEKCAELKSVQ